MVCRENWGEIVLRKYRELLEQTEGTFADGDGLISALIAVATTQKFYDEHPDVIEKLNAAQDEIASYMADDQDAAMETVAKALDLDVDAMKEMYGFYDFSTEIMDADNDGFQKTADFMYESGMIENELDVNTLFIQ